MKALLAHRDIRLLVLARFVDMLGDNVMWIALGIWIKELTGSNSAAGMSFFVFILGTLFSPLGGGVVDRVRRGPLIVVLNLVSALVVLPLLLVHSRGEVWLIYAVMLGYGVVSGLTGSAMTAYTQTLVPAAQLGEANGLIQTALQGLRLVAPLIGAGVLSAFGIAPLVVGDVATFLLAALLIRAVRRPEAAPGPRGGRQRGELLAGVRHILGTLTLRQAALASVLGMLAFGISESVFFAVIDQGLHRPPAFLGVISSLEGVGAIAAGAMAGRLMRRIGESRLVALGMAAAGVGFGGACVGSVWVVGAGVTLVGASLPWIIAGLMTLFQRSTPSELMGRTSAALGVVLSVPQTTAIALGAGLVAVVDFRLLLTAMAVLMALGAGYLFTRRPVAAPTPTEAAVETARAA